jgi:DNA-binding LacI/PurR family transcriptional regulator
MPVSTLKLQKRPRPAVMADVARIAGVSYQTVSRVLHDSPHVRGDTRDRVLAAIRQLDYRPNSMARALVTGRSKTLGVVSFDTTLYGPASTLLGIEQAAHDVGYAVTVSSLRSLNRDNVLDAIERLRDQGVDGVAVIAPVRAGVDALRHIRSDFAVVAVEAGPNAPIPVAAVDQMAGAAAATRHLLLALGRAARLERCRGTHRGLEVRARGGPSSNPAATPGRLDAALRL